jgi:pyridoxamine 5'-phosphate oxidase
VPYGSGMAEHSQPLLEHEVAADPFAQFGRWYREAGQVARVPEAAALATASLDARPSVRMVLMKAWDERGFVFYSNGESRKGGELEENPVGALLFYWDQLGRQLRIEGPVSRVSDAESDDYFASRPLGAQIATSISNQSRVITSRQELDERMRRALAGSGAGPVQRPPSWRGFRVEPEAFEFWQNRDDRLHDRLRYTRGGTAADGGPAWLLERLQP